MRGLNREHPGEPEEVAADHAAAFLEAAEWLIEEAAVLEKSIINARMTDALNMGPFFAEAYPEVEGLLAVRPEESPYVAAVNTEDAGHVTRIVRLLDAMHVSAALLNDRQREDR